MNNYRICIIDDELNQAKQLADYLKDSGYDTHAYSSAGEFLAYLEKNYTDLIISDLKMPEMSGLNLLNKVKAINPDISMIIVTAYGTVEDAVKAMREGASDFLTKPVDLDELDFRLQKIFQHRLLKQENQVLKEALHRRSDFDDIIYRSTQMDEVLNLVSRVSDSEASVLIRGESGTGKEMIAQAIHSASPRRDKAMVTVNCAAIPDALFESEFFGHEKGAFTGAHERKAGRLDLAKGGTLFLDEVADIPLNFQVKLLRVLQNGDYQRLGSSQTSFADIRVVSATNRDMEIMIQNGSFRADLYYRLNVISIDLPTLRSRKEDIPVLVDFFIRKHAARNRRKVKGIQTQALDLLMKYSFPGNIRELENMVERAVILARAEQLLPADFLIPRSEEEDYPARPVGSTLTEKVKDLEKKLITEALKNHAFVQTKAAESLGLTERGIRYKMQKYGIAKTEL